MSDTIKSEGARGGEAGHRVAIVGCGPSGCFTAQALRKRLPAIDITVLDALPTPYGLIRHGIAPDHQGAKAVHRQFDRLFSQPGVRFVGNTRVGGDLPLERLLDSFDAVVFATGLAKDRPLDVTPEPGARVIGAGALLRLLNSDPDTDLRRDPGGVRPIGEVVAIVGTGNVAVDVARLLTKSRSELASSDVDDVAREALIPRRIKTIHVIGRCAPDEAKWDPSMLKELAAVHLVDLYLEGEAFDPGAEPALGSTRVDVQFRQTIDSVAWDGERTQLNTSAVDDSSRRRTYRVDTVISAVGFQDASVVKANPGILDHPHVFQVGGPASGRLGNLAENRKLAAATAQSVADHLAATTARGTGTHDIDRHLPAHRVTFDDWKRIEHAETTRAAPDRCRLKFTTRSELLAAAARSTSSDPAGHSGQA